MPADCRPCGDSCNPVTGLPPGFWRFIGNLSIDSIDHQNTATFRNLIGNKRDLPFILFACFLSSLCHLLSFSALSFLLCFWLSSVSSWSRFVFVSLCFWFVDDFLSDTSCNWLSIFIARPEVYSKRFRIRMAIFALEKHSARTLAEPSVPEETLEESLRTPLKKEI